LRLADAAATDNFVIAEVDTDPTRAVGTPWAAKNTSKKL
jgi:hypothetical protein